MKKFRKGELQFFKGALPKELKDYIKDYPSEKEYVDQFLEIYVYDYVAKKWIKKDEHKTIMDRFKGE